MASFFHSLGLFLFPHLKLERRTGLRFALHSPLLFVTAQALAIEHHPTIPRFEANQHVAVLAAPGLCARIRDHVLSVNGITQVAPDAADSVLLIVGSQRPVLAGPYANIEAITADVRSRLNPAECEARRSALTPAPSGALYVFERARDGLLHRTFYSRPACGDFADSTFFCSESILLPGAVMVQFRKAMTIDDIETFASDYGLEGLSGRNSEAGNGIVFSVPVRTEEAWVFTLRRFPKIAEATRIRADVVAVHSEGAFATFIVSNDRPRAPLSFAEVRQSLERTLVRTEAFLNATFRGKGNVAPLKKNPKRISVEVSGLRGEVLKSEGYWEKLIIECIFAPDERRMDFFINITGSYATGAGSLRPADDSFDDMDQKYKNPLQSFADKLTVELQNALERN